jgi:uncharacterized protein
MEAPHDEFEAAFREGIELFNKGEFFECHEVWERLWMETGGERADLLKGLLQAAIALHHYRRRNFAGARKLYDGQKRILTPFRPSREGLDLGALDRDMDSCFASLLRSPPDAPAEFEPARQPRIART